MLSSSTVFGPENLSAKLASETHTSSIKLILKRILESFKWLFVPIVWQTEEILPVSINVSNVVRQLKLFLCIYQNYFSI